jgi:fucokinase
VDAPVRLDFGGGWSDTPPFCLDWGGMVLNAAVELNGVCPIRASARVIEEPVIRFVSERDPAPPEIRTLSELPAQAPPGDPFAIPIAALRMTGLFESAEPAEALLRRMGGGIEITVSVNLPMGSGLGTSSILAAAVMRALLEILGRSPEPQELSEQVLRIEQAMTTGGGWQDQAGGIYPGIKLVTSGPGCPQRLRVQPIRLTPEREAEFHELLVLYYTGIRRIARGLLRQVVGSYLARETAAIQVLHSIKTLALEMGYAVEEGDWDYLGRLLDRHWELNQVLDPHTTNAPINALLETVRPYVRGAKLAGAGGGGFLILLARSREAAGDLKSLLARDSSGGALFDCRLSTRGLRAEAE